MPIPQRPSPTSHGFARRYVGVIKDSKVPSTHEKLAGAPESEADKAVVEAEVVGVARLVLTPIREDASSET